MLSRRVAALKVAPATDAAAQIGPMINARALDKIARHVDDAVAHGARVLAGGRRLAELGPNYYAPTVLADANHDMLLCREETFGPVVAAVPLRDRGRGDSVPPTIPRSGSRRISIAKA